MEISKHQSPLRKKQIKSGQIAQPKRQKLPAMENLINKLF